MTRAADMQYLRWHWGEEYELADEDGRCTAVARFGSRDVLEADSPSALLVLVRRHYPRTRRTDRSST
jgi:hypothetical protein